jgi:hypothetical protein
MDDRGSIPDRDKRFFSALQRPERMWGPPSSIPLAAPPLSTLGEVSSLAYGSLLLVHAPWLGRVPKHIEYYNNDTARLQTKRTEFNNKIT